MLFFSILAFFATAVAAISINAGDRYDSSLDVGSIANGITSERGLTLAREGKALLLFCQSTYAELNLLL